MASQAKFKDRHTRISKATFAKVAVNGTAREQQESSGVRSLLSQQGKPLGSLCTSPTGSGLPACGQAKNGVCH